MLDRRSALSSLIDPNPAERGRVAMRCLVAMALVASLPACHGTPVLSSSHRPDNIYDVALFEGSGGNDEEIAVQMLARRYPSGSITEALLSYLVGIGSDCARQSVTQHVCRISSFLEAKSAFWLFDIQLTAGETLALWEYTYVTTIESSGGKIRSIDVVRERARLK